MSVDGVDVNICDEERMENGNIVYEKALEYLLENTRRIIQYNVHNIQLGSVDMNFMYRKGSYRM